MSEYQCYEFVALDRPLTSKQMEELRAVSTRADITPTRFWNEYQWGDLKADPAKLMERYFDAHMYFANWGTHRLMLRIPLTRVDATALAAYFVGDTAGIKRGGAHLVIDLRSEDEEPDYYEAGQGSLAALAPLRAEIMCGDTRPAYLAWLMAVQNHELDDDDHEPPVPPGLAELSAAQEAMIDFLRIDGDLVAAAATASTAAPDDSDALRAWLKKLTPRAKDEWLGRAADAPDLPLGAELLRAFRAQSKPTKGKAANRSVAELLAAADRHREARHRAEAARAEKAKRAAEAAKNKRLDALSKRIDAAWSELARLVETSAYDAALVLATDLRALAVRDGEDGDFAARFAVLRKQHLRRRGFFDRWNRHKTGEAAR